MPHDEIAIDAAVIDATRQHVDVAGDPLKHVFARLDQALWLRQMRTQQQRRVLYRRLVEIDGRFADLVERER
jgi:hypothetical protein